MANNTLSGFQAVEPYIVAYYALLLIIFGTLFNMITFIVFCRAKFRNAQERSTIHYMRAIAIVDILMLYGWNFDHYLTTVYGFSLGSTSIAACKISIFINYFAPQASAWLRIFTCLDRYLCLSRLGRTWFSSTKNALIIIAVIVIFFTFFNLHILILACTYNASGRITGNTSTYKIFPLWDWVNLGLYNGIPFFIMAYLNTGVIYHLFRLKNTSTVQNSRIQHRSMSITLVITTVAFMLLTIPPTVCYGFFYSKLSVVILHLLDSLMYTYHVMAFPLYLITLTEFRREFYNLIRCGMGQQRIRPFLTTTHMTRQ